MELVNFSDDWIITTGIRMESHDSKKVIMNADIKTGFKYGMHNLKNILTSLAPSRRAALIISNGNFLIFCLKRNTKNGVLREDRINAK